jgi:hypothetical protein
VLVLNANNISSVPEEGLNGMPRLKLLSIGNNPIIGSRRYGPELRKQVPTAYVFTLPITKENLKKVGIAAASVIAVALTVAGAYMQKKSVKPEEEEGRNMQAEADLLREAKALRNLYQDACRSGQPLSGEKKKELEGKFHSVREKRNALIGVVAAQNINDLIEQVASYLKSNVCESSQSLDAPAEGTVDEEEIPRLTMKIAVLMLRDGTAPTTEEQIEQFKRFVDAAEGLHVLAPSRHEGTITYKDYEDKYEELKKKWSDNSELAEYVREKLKRDIKFIKSMRHMWQLK